MKKINNEISIIDWKKIGWDYEHSMLSHNLRGDPSVPSVKLWPNSFKVCARQDRMCGVYEWLRIGMRIPPRVV
jgi:hypothetical protein